MTSPDHPHNIKYKTTAEHVDKAVDLIAVALGKIILLFEDIPRRPLEAMMFALFIIEGAHARLIADIEFAKSNSTFEEGFRDRQVLFDAAFMTMRERVETMAKHIRIKNEEENATIN